MKKLHPDHIKAEILVMTPIQKRADIMASPVENLGLGSIAAPYTPTILADMSSINTYHGRCINLKAQLTVGLGYELQPKEGEKANEQEKKIWSDFETLHAQNQGQQFVETLINWCIDFETFGNGFLEGVRNNGGKIAELIHLPALNCSFVREEVGKAKSKIVFLRQAVLDETAKFKRFGDEGNKGLNEYIHLKQYAPKSKYYGIPEWMTALAAMYLDRNANTYNIKRFSNDLLIGVAIMMSGGKLDVDSRKAIKSFLTKNYKGIDAEDAGGALVLNSEEADSKIDIKTIAAEVKEASYHILRIDNREEVVDAHGVPRRLVGLTRAGGLGDVNATREEMAMFRNLSIRPRQMRIEFMFNTFILPAMEINSLNFKLNQIETSEDTLDAQYFSLLTTKNIDGESVLDIEEARKGLGYPPRTAAVVKSNEDLQALRFVKMLIKIREQLKVVG
jgi:HK97 family phage portal protein